MIKYLLILVLLTSCAPVKYYPRGNIGTAIPYLIDYSGQQICYICKQKSELIKIDSKNRIICNKCYRERVY